MIALFILIGLVALIAFYAMSVQRGLVKKEERVKNALSSIGIQVQSRWDALKQLANTVKGYKDHEAETLTNVIAARSGAVPKTAEEVNASEADYGRAMGAINVLVERYPELKADSLFQKMMDDINSYENKVRVSRQVYNDTATKYNQSIRMFPGSIFAGMFGFTVAQYLETPKEKQDMPELQF